MLGIMKRKFGGLLTSIRDVSLLKDLNTEETKLMESIKQAKLTYLSKGKLASIIYSIRNLKANNIEGLMIETGCALGGSAILITKLKDSETKFNVYDVFGMIPPPTEEDDAAVHKRYKIISEGNSIGIKGDKYYGYEDKLYDKVLNNFSTFNVDLKKENTELIRGLVQETMNISEPVKFAHVDVDWYDPVKTCLEQIWPNLVVGGVLILDDYYDWGGCRKATDEFFSAYKGQFEMDKRYGSLKVTRTQLPK